MTKLAKKTPVSSSRPCRFAVLTAGLVLLGSMIGCNSGDSPTAPHAGGTLAIELTDAPTGGLDELWVYISGLSIKPDNDDPVTVVSTDVGLVDLLALQDTSQLLATAGVTPGTYNHIFVELDEDQSYVVETGDTEHKPIHIASEKILVLGGFEVDQNLMTTVLLDFDAEQSLRHTGAEDPWVLVPVIIQAQVSQS